MFDGRIVLTYGVPGGVGVLLVTYTSIRQRCPARIVPPVKEMEVAPVPALREAAGPQPVTAAGVELLTLTPVGKGSVTEKFVRSVSLGAMISIRSLELPPTGMEDGEKDFTPVTSVPLTVTFAVAAVRLPTPCAVVSKPGPIRLVSVPEAVPVGTVTTTSIVQVPGVVGLPAGIVPPLKATAVEGVMDTAPPQLLLDTLVAVMGLGKVSVKVTPV
jgi:hypothetical protein